MRRILVVEDDESQARDLCRMLRARRFDCDIANSFAEAIDKAKSAKYDCIVLDPGQPDFPTGKETISHINSFPFPVVVYTGSGDPGMVDTARETGASYVVKPGFEFLVHEINSQINYRNADEESRVEQQKSQRRLMGGPMAGEKEKFSLWSAIRENVGFSILVISAISAFFIWTIEQVKDNAKRWLEVADNRNELTRQQIEFTKRISENTNDIHIIQLQNQISVDDRASIHKQIDRIETDLARRLERIEEKIDRMKDSKN